MTIFTYNSIERRQIADFGQAVIDSMNAHVAVVDRDGVIILVNEAWQRFIQESCDECIDHLGVGENYWHYLTSCLSQSCSAAKKKTQILAGMEMILAGQEPHFTLEYPCHGPLGEHWFLLSATPLGAEPMGIVISHIDITERHQSEQALAALNQQLRHLTARLEKVQEAERAHLARELHDELGQQLTALRMALNWVKSRLPDTAAHLNEKMVELIGLVDTTTHSVRRIASDLRPMMLDDLGAIAAIEWLTEDFSKRTGIPCQLTLDEVELNGHGTLATILFRLIQESLTNVARHAKATQVSVSIRQNNATLIIHIHDNGQGFVVRDLAPLDSLGLVGMQERAKMVGGSVNINSQPGAGTDIHIELPLTSFTHGETTHVID